MKLDNQIFIHTVIQQLYSTTALVFWGFFDFLILFEERQMPKAMKSLAKARRWGPALEVLWPGFGSVKSQTLKDKVPSFAVIYSVNA